VSPEIPLITGKIQGISGWTRPCPTLKPLESGAILDKFPNMEQGIFWEQTAKALRETAKSVLAACQRISVPGTWNFVTVAFSHERKEATVAWAEISRNEVRSNRDR
jgi:hypothetical protein